MRNAPRVDDMSGGRSVDRLSIGCAEQQPEKQHKSAMEDEVLGGGDHGYRGWNLRGLTFDVRGGRQQAKPDVARPLDGRVRPLWMRTPPCPLVLTPTA